MSKSDDDIWYGLRLPARRCAPASSASAGNGRSGSTGRRVATGRGAVCIAFSADLITSQTSSTGTMRASLRPLSSWSSTTEEIPTTTPPALKTGPPVLPGASLKSATLACGSTRTTRPSDRSFCPRSGAPMAATLSPSAKGGADPGADAGVDTVVDPSLLPTAQFSGTGRTDAVVAGSIQRTATSRTRSATRTRAATLTDEVSCTSTADALPIARWFVTTRPPASMTNPDARDPGVQTRTTLSFHWGRRSDASFSVGAGDEDGAGAGPTSAFSAVSSRITSRPAAISSVCVH
jgi:hypothetical protein